MRTQTYAFLGVNIAFDSEIPGLFDFIGEHLNLRPASGSAKIEYVLERGEPVLPDVPPTEILDFVLHGIRKFYIYRLDGSRTWCVYEGVGSVCHDYESGRISVRCLMEEPAFLTLYVLCAQALIRALSRWELYYLHGACLSYVNRGILIAGVSGRGKSTAAYALRRDGAKILTDEAALIDARTGRVASFVNAVKLREEAAARFFPDARPFYRDGGDLYLRLSDLGGGPESVDRIDDLFILEKTGRPETGIVPAEPTQVFPELLPTTIHPDSPYRLAQRVEAVCALIGGARCHAVQFGTDMDAFARCVRDTLVSG